MTSVEQVAAPTRKTVGEYRETLASVVERAEEIKRWSVRYPVFLMLTGKLYRFNNPSDVERFIAKMKSELATYDLQYGKKPQAVASL